MSDSITQQSIPVLTLRDVIVFPYMVIPLFVGRKKSINALNKAMDNGEKLLLLTQTSGDIDDPTMDDVYQMGTIATILQLLKLPDGTYKVLVEGERRARVISSKEEDGYFVAETEVYHEDEQPSTETDALSAVVSELFEKYVKLNKKIPSEVMSSVLAQKDSAPRLLDTIASHLAIKAHEKQALLENLEINERFSSVIEYLENEINILEVESKVGKRVKKQMENSQREYYLNEKMKAIQNELGELENGAGNEIEALAKRIKKAKMSKEARKKAKAEINKLKMMSPMSAEATVVRNYIETLTDVPWRKHSETVSDLKHAEKILNEEHYGLETVKERILEYLAVQQRVDKIRSAIMCLVGPPGVGKTSLAQSIARATGRRYVRMALGGVRDEAEIRGHRRTYIGAMPGKIIQNISKVKRKNPLFLLDEIDKMAQDFRGDPASALLEVLDPEQNHTFTDHYLEVEYDLSNVMFVATSNSMNMPEPLLDRMEIIRLSGYTEAEKLKIAQNYLVPKQIKDNGLKKSELSISETAIVDMIRYYSRESGVRSLDRLIGKVCRKVVREHIENKKQSTRVSTRNIDKYLGVRPYDYGKADKNDQIGQVTGLAWTSVGGDLLTIESVTTRGDGLVKSTGSLGKVMEESISAAHTVVKSRAASLGIAFKQLKSRNTHIHVPEGATPKDGPSAGIAMVTAIVSAYTKIPVKAEVAMTGEITLRGEVLPIGGLKEKLLAAHRGGIKTVIIPFENRKNLEDVPDIVKQGLDIHAVKWIDEVLEIALAEKLTPIDDDVFERDAEALLAGSGNANAAESKHH